MDTEDAGAALVPIRVQQVQFYGDEITAAEVAPGQVYVPLRTICDNLGLDWPSQYQRLKRDPVLTEASTSVVVTTTDRGNRAMIALPLDMLPGWLFGINAARVKPELQEKITRYRRECFKVLWQAFAADILPSSPPTVGLTLAEQAVEQARALLTLATQQVEFERRLNTLSDYMRPFVRETRGTLKDYGERLTGLELQLSAGATIDQAQQSEIQLAVKAVAAALEAQGKANGYQRVYSELYRRYSLSGYKQLPRARYDDAMAWLKKWFDELGGKAAAEGTTD